MKTFLVALIMGAFGAVAVVTSSSLSLPTWVMFLAWVSYYVFGRSLQKAGVSLLQIICGILMGICMQVSAGILTGLLGPAGFPIAVFVLIGSLTYITQIKILSNIPAWFIGLIIFFGVRPEIAPLPIVSLLIPIIIGFAFAYLNDTTIHKFIKH